MAKSSNKWLERYTDGGLYIPLEGTSYVVRQQISKPRTYGDGGKYLTVNGEYHRVYENAEGDIMVNHPKEDKGKWDTINLTQKAKVKTIAQGIAATKKWHRENPEYANGGLGDGDDPKKPKTVIYNDYNKYLKAKQAYDDSLALYNASNQARVNNLLRQGFVYDTDKGKKQNYKLTDKEKKEYQRSLVNPKKGLQNVIQEGNDGKIDKYLGGKNDTKAQYELMHGKIAPVAIAPLVDNLWRNSPYLYEYDGSTLPGHDFDKNKPNFRKNPNYGKPYAKDKNGVVIRNFFSVPIYAKPTEPKYQELEEVKSKDESFMFPGVLSYDKKEMTPFAEEDLNFSDYTKTINDLKENKSEIKKPNTQIKNNNSSSFKNKIKKLKREFFPGYRLPYQYQSAKVPFFENGGWLNQYEQGGYADDSAVLNSEGQEVNTMQFALPTVPTFNFGNGNGNGNGDGEDPKDKKKSKDKKTDTRTVAQKRHDALEAAKTKILKTESPENKKKMDMLYSTTIAAENTYGYDPNAYGRKKQTRSPMSIDNIALDELFNPKGEKNRYTLQQKSNFDLLRSLGLPTDKAKLKELLETDDAYAGLGVAKTLYYNEGALKNLPNPTDTAAYINLYLNEYNKSGALKYQKRNELIDNITNKMRAEGKRKTKTIKPVVKNKTTK